MEYLIRRVEQLQRRIERLEKKAEDDALMDSISLFCSFCGEIKPCICDITEDALTEY